MRRISAYIHEIFRPNLPPEKVMKDVFHEIQTTLERAYSFQSTQSYLKSLPVHSLAIKGAEFYAGSSITPRNQKLTKMLLSLAEKKAKESQNERLVNLVEYYYAYLIKLASVKEANVREYESSSQILMELAQKGEPLSNYISGKEFLKILENGNEVSWSNDQIISNSKKMFMNSICDRQFAGIYYLAYIEKNFIEAENHQENREKILEQIFTQSASLGFPLAYFQIANKYKNEANSELYKKYLLMAAEAGVLEAQHNLAVEYSKGEYFPKDELKSFAWFLHASTGGFVYSKYNLSRILRKGTQCGKVKPNYKAALIYLEELHREGVLEVQEEINELMELMKGK